MYVEEGFGGEAVEVVDPKAADDVAMWVAEFDDMEAFEALVPQEVVEEVVEEVEVCVAFFKPDADGRGFAPREMASTSCARVIVPARYWSS